LPLVLASYTWPSPQHIDFSAGGRVVRFLMYKRQILNTWKAIGFAILPLLEYRSPDFQQHFLGGVEIFFWVGEFSAEEFFSIFFWRAHTLVNDCGVVPVRRRRKFWDFSTVFYCFLMKFVAQIDF